MAKSWVFIDSRVSDREQLIAQFAPGTRYLVLDESRDGIGQIVSALGGESGYDSIQIISHGSPGSLTLGSIELNRETLGLYATQLAVIGNTLTDTGDLLLYGCNVAADQKGEQFVNALSQMTGADVAASDDKTGSEATGGDWALETRSGQVETTSLNVTEYQGSLGADSQIPAGLVNPPYSWAGISFTYRVNGEITTSDPLNTFRSGCYWDRYELTGVANGTAVYLYMGNSSTVDDYLQIERSSVMIAYNDDGGDGERGYDSYLSWSYLAGDVIRATTYSAGNTGTYSLYTSTGILNDIGDNNLGTVTFTGTSTQGETLTAQPPTDADGVTAPVNYRWQISPDNSAWTTISGVRGEAATLTLDQSESHQYVRVQAFYTDGKGRSESPASASQFVADVPDPGQLSITGMAVAGHSLEVQELSDVDGLLMASPLYQWQFSGDGNTGWTNIDGANNDSYILAHADAGYYFRLLTTYTDDMGYNETDVTSNVMGVVNPNAVPVISDFSRFGDEGTVISFSEEDFGNHFTDGNGDSLYDIQISSVPENGLLWVNGVEVTPGLYLSLSELSGLSFVPDASWHGITGFSWQASDGIDSSDYASVEIVVIDKTPPVFLDSAPFDNATDVAVDSSLELYFDEDVMAGSGYLIVSNDFGDYRSINVQDGSQVSFSGSMLTINPLNLLRTGRLYSVQMSAGVVLDIAGNFFAGISDPTVLNFETAPNTAPILTVFSNEIATTLEDTEATITIEALKAQGDEADAEGAIDGFVVSSVSSGSLKIGTDAASATPFDALTNNSIDATHKAFWTGAENTNGVLDAFMVVAKDIDGALSDTPIQAVINVTAVNDLPVLTTFDAAIVTTSEDTTTTITFDALKAQGDEADVDGTVVAFVVKSLSGGTLKIGLDAASATPWNATTNKTIDAAHTAFWTPAADANGALNAFTVVAKDDSGAESVGAVQVRVEITPVNDAPELGVGADGLGAEGAWFNHVVTLGDPDPDSHLMTVNWGDGTGNTQFDSGMEHTLTLSHFYADNGTFTVTVTADDQQGEANSVETQDFQVAVSNVAPTAQVTGNDRVNEGASYLLHVGAVADPGSDSRTAYSIDWGDGSSSVFTPVEWAAAAGEFSHIYNIPGAVEVSHTITVHTTDEDGPFVLGSRFVTVNVPPSNLSISNDTIAENTLGGTVVGTLSTSDAGAHTYTLTDNADGRFALSGNQILVAPGAILDYESNTSHTIRVRSTDTEGLSFDKELSIHLLDMGPDLLVTDTDSTQSITTIDAGSSMEIFWTVSTSGTEQTNATWVDRVYFDNPATPGLDRWIGDYSVSMALPLADALTRIQTVQLPWDMFGDFRIVVLTDNNNQVREGTAGEGNNTTYGDTLYTILNANLQVASITAPSSAFTGREIEVEWIVGNVGNTGTDNRYWYDALYLSSDAVLDGTDVRLATVRNESYLEAGEQYHNIARVTLPSGIEGEYHILVKTDVNNSVPEGGFENDNVTSSAVLDIQPIPLSELSDLAVVSVAAPVQALSGQNMSITYTIDNAGQAAIAGSSPYWVERIYMSSDEVLDGSDRLLGTIWRDLGAAQIPQPENASHFTTTEKVVLPVGVSGGYYFFVTVSPVGSVTNVFTSNDSAYDATPVDVRLTPPPDLQVSGIASSATAVAGHDLTVSYRVINTGATTTPNSGWYDALYLSANTTLDAGDSLLSEVWHSGQLAPAGSAQSIPLADAMALYASGAANGYYINTVNVHLNDALSGTWYLIAKTDTRDMVFELDNVDNTGDAVALGIESRPADLVVSEVAAASVVQAGQSLRVSWSVLNQGVGDTAASQWYDRIVLSNDTVFGDGDDVVLGTYAHSGILGVNKEYSNSAQVSIPSNLSGSYQLFVTTDIYSQVYEAAKEDNNSRPLGVGIDWKPGDPIPDGGIETKPQPTADLQVVSVTVPDRVNSGEKLSVAFTVTNAGQGSTNSNYWWDKVILSGDALVGNGDDVVLGTVYHANTLSSGESYSASASLTIPVDYTGEYHVFVRTDSNGNVTETGAENNNSAEASNTTTIDLSPVPDLVMSSASAADEGVSGRDLAVSWTVRNDGAATTGNWRQTFYLSRDGVLDRSSDIYLGYSDSVSGLGAGSEVALSASFRIPVGLSGRYYVFGVVDSGNWIYERSGENNNTVLDSTPVQITAPAPVDLVAGTISVPVNGIAGGLATIQYTVTNESAVSLSGHWRDNIYLSTDAVWDVGDALFDRVEISGPLAGSASYTQTATGTLPGLIGGDYYVIVRSDILNQVTESDETNNLSASVDSTHLDVEVLSLGIPDSDVLVKGGALYYRVDAGAGDTLLIDFDRDAGAGRTELYVSYGDMPSRSDFDYRYSVVDSPDQRIVISNAKAGSYYVMAYNTQGSADSYTITADKLVFSITEVGTDTGSNRGKVTIRIDGAELTTHTVAMLVDGDGVEHAAEKIYWKDGTELWATFDLQGMNTGVCDIRIQDGVRTAELHDGFTVNSQEVGHVEFRIETIAAMRPGQTATARIYYQNTGETDVAAPLLNISGNALLKLSGADEFGDTSLQLLGINSEGPAGILAPGAEGSFQIFFKPDFSGGGTVNLSVSTMNPDAVIDWNTILEASRPDNVSNEAWETVRANLITELGTTAGDYENNLSGIATLLDQLEGRTNDLTRLFGLDFQKASDDGNLLLPATLGVFGYSHTFAWDITAVSQSDGKVLVDLAGTKLLFTHEADGSYKLSGQGTTTLSESGGVFVLHQQNGTTITFNLDGRFSEIEDNNGHTRQAVYIDGKLGEVVTDTGGHWTYTYNEAGRLITEVDHTGRNISYAYDADNQHLLSITSPEGTKQYSYVTDGAARHLISTITGTDGTIHHYEYDGNGRLEREYLNDGAESVSYHYSGVNEVTVTDAAGVTAHFWINEDGQIAQIENARGNVTQLRYDGNGNVIETVSPDGSSSSMSYDADGKIIGTQDALGHSVAFSYEPSFGNLTQVTDQRGNAIGYGYDDRGNLNSVTYADGSSETYSYHSDGTLDIAVSRSGQNIGYTYDALGRLIQKAYADGTTASYTYDLHGNLTSATDADSAMSFEYDAANNLLKVTDVDGRWIGYAYDQAGRRIEMSDQTGREVHYSYDDEGHLSGLREADGTLIVSYQYDAAGRLSRSDNGNGTYTTYEHDIAGQLLHLVNCQQDGTVNSRFDYTYDEMGRRTSETTLDGSSTYGYDAIGQLSEVTLSSGRHIVYHYDAAGNRTYVEDNGIGSNYLVNNLNEYVSGGAVSWGYDANGNMTSRSEGGVVTTYGYDAENQLVSVARPGDIWSYEYDALGNRIASEHNGERIEYQLDPKGVASVAAEYDAAGNLAASYTYGLGLENETLADGTTAWYDFNAIGSTAGLSGSAGSYVNEYSYLPFGETLLKTESLSNPFEYVGQWGVMDESNGLDFMRARFYSADEGRFMQTDPAGITGGLNLYAYSGNSPLNYIDPTGYFSWGEFGSGLLNVVGGGLAIAVLVATAPVSMTVGAVVVASAVALSAGWSIGTGVQQMIAGAQDQTHPFEGGLFEDLAGLSGNETAKSVGSIADNVLGLVSGRVLSSPQKSGKLIELGIEKTSSLLEKSEWGTSIVSNLLNVWGNWLDVFDLWNAKEEDKIVVVVPRDPNDIVGPQGFGDENWTSTKNALGYTIRFENQASATAPAQEVTVTQTLDSDLDPASFRLGDFGWGDLYVDVPDGALFYIDRLDLRETKGYMVDVVAGIDIEKHEVYWTFTTIDPETGEIPEDPTVGFLPPDTDGVIGQGFVNYTIRPNYGVTTGTVIDAEATIVFTTQEPIDTPAISNTLDTALPVSQVDPLTGLSEVTVDSAQFLVQWSGNDVGSAIASYSVYVSDNGGGYTAWLENSTQTEANYAGEQGHTYAFYTRAADNAGNVEAAPSFADLVVHVDADAVLSDTASPQINEVVLPSARQYVAGETLDFTFRFSEAVVVDVSGQPPVIRVTIGSSEVDALYQSGSGSDSILFRYVIADGESDTDGIALGGEIVTNGAVIRDIAGNLIADLTFAAGATDGIRIDLPPILSSFSDPVEQTTRNKQVAISLAELLAKGNESDADGTVDALVIKSVTGGSLKIGADAASATSFNATTNNSVDALHQAFWTPALDTYGLLDAFTAVAKDNAGIESATPVQVKVDVLTSIVGSPGNDQQSGTGGDDQMYGEAGNDTLVGNGGNDLLDGGNGADRLEGGSGNDVYLVDNPGDVVKEIAGNGTDSIESGITWTLGANVENLTLTGSGAINGKGNVLDNVITGNDGANVLNGVTGNDTILGGGGNDTINGGTGVDVMTGGAGNDLFVFDYLATTESGVVAISHDIITDFVSGQDRLDLSAIDANVRVSGNQVFDSAILSVMNPFTAAGQLRFDGASGMLYGNTDNNLLTAEFTIELTGVTSLLAGDIVY